MSSHDGAMERHQARVDALRGVLEDHDMEESMIEPTAQRLAIMQRHAIASSLPGASREMLRDLEDAHEEASRREGFIATVLKSPFRFMGRHPIVTALGLGAGAYFGAPYLFRLFGRAEGAASGPGLDWLNRLFRARGRLGTGTGDANPAPIVRPYGMG